jgi:hypothetical protein
VDSPWTLTITTEKMNRGQWVVSLFNRYIPDFCLSMKSEHEPWFAVTKHLKNSCPFSAGVSYTFSYVANVILDSKFPKAKGKFQHGVDNGLSHRNVRGTCRKRKDNFKLCIQAKRGNDKTMFENLLRVCKTRRRLLKSSVK